MTNDVLEHVPDLEQMMTNCLALLALGGVMRIAVPYDLSLGAWQDPTHVRGFNQNSWLYFTDWFWSLGWFEYRFELSQFEFMPSELGRRLLAEGRSQQEVLDTPRAVDAMHVTLTKVRTSAEERTQARSYLGSLVVPAAAS